MVLFFSRSSSGANVGLKLFELNYKLPKKYLKDNEESFDDKKEINDNIWQKLETLSMQRSSELFSTNNPPNIYTSTPLNWQSNENNNVDLHSFTGADGRRYLIKRTKGDSNDKKRKRKKLLLDKKDSSWSKLSKAGGYLIEKSLTVNNSYHKGEINNCFEGDIPCQSTTTIFSSTSNNFNCYSTDYNDKLAEIIRRMDRVLLNASKKFNAEPKL